MSPEKQRIAIAEVCGWQMVSEFENALHEKVRQYRKTIAPEDGVYARAMEWELPDYLSDLNAMHEVEGVEVSKNGYNFQVEYMVQLENVALRRRPNCTSLEVRFWLSVATAAQRAEAFLRTLGKWEESPSAVRSPDETK